MTYARRPTYNPVIEMHAIIKKLYEFFKYQHQTKRNVAKHKTQKIASEFTTIVEKCKVAVTYYT
jgi:hypothetical protein